MNQPNASEYYLNRAATSRSLAQRAAKPAIAAIHAEFATRYEQLARPERQTEGTTPVVQAA